MRLSKRKIGLVIHQIPGSLVLQSVLSVYYTPGRGKIVPHNVMERNLSLPCKWPTKNLTTSSWSLSCSDLSVQFWC